MQVQTKLVFLELLGGVFGWIWIGSSVLTIYLFGAALFFEGSWSTLLWTIGMSIIAKWLAKGINDNKGRVSYVDDLMGYGFSWEDASNAWLEAYNGGRNILFELKNPEESANG